MFIFVVRVKFLQQGVLEFAQEFSEPAKISQPVKFRTLRNFRNPTVALATVAVLSFVKKTKKNFSFIYIFKKKIILLSLKNN